jgi:hypothetical protein
MSTNPPKIKVDMDVVKTNWRENIRIMTGEIITPTNKSCSHVYRYLRTIEDVDVFYCEKCLHYEYKGNNI